MESHLYNYVIHKSTICVKVLVEYMFFLGPKANMIEFLG